MMDFSNLNIKNTKIFKSMFSLEYKNPTFEQWYKSSLYENYGKILKLFSQFLLFFGIFLATLEGVLFFTSGRTINRNLKSNFYFTLFHLIMSAVIFSLNNYSKVNLENQYVKYLLQFFIHFCFENFFLSLISILLVYFHLGIEIISFTFFIQTITKCLISFLIHKSFLTSLINISICFAFKAIFLLGIHVIKAIIYYLIVHFAFLMIVLGFVYMYEYMTRKFIYSLYRVVEEKKYFLDTLSHFNISYFRSKNNKIKQYIKLESLIKNLPEKIELHKNSSICLIEDLLKTSIVSIDSNLPNQVERYLVRAKNKNNFKFKKFFKILKEKEENKNYFKNFNSTVVVHRPNLENPKEKFFFQLLLRIKIKTINPDNANEDSEQEDFNSINFIDQGITVKFEGIFLDVTADFLKKETKANSYILAKYIHDIKSPLFLLKQIVENYNSFVKKKLSALTKFLENYDNNKLLEINSDTEFHNKYSYNLKTISKYIFEIIENINNFTKKQNNLYNTGNSIENKVSQIDIRKLINRCLDFFKIYSEYYSNKKNIRVFAEIEGHVPQYIYSNKNSLKQVIMNLLSNSLKFTYRGEIKIVCKLKSKLELSEERKFIEINVIDTGVGIEEENVVKICKPFFMTTSKANEGSGLGISIVIDLLNSIGSKLSIYSVKNKGSNFSFELPVGCSNSILKEDNSYTHKKIIEAVNANETNLQNCLFVEEPDESHSPFELKLQELEFQLNHEDSKTIIFDGPLDKKSITNNFFYKLLTGIEEDQEECIPDNLHMMIEESSAVSDKNDIDQQIIRTKRRRPKRIKSQREKSPALHPLEKKRNRSSLNIGTNSKIVLSSNSISVNKNKVNVNIMPTQQQSNQIHPVPWEVPAISSIKPRNKVNYSSVYRILIIDDDPTYVSQMVSQIKAYSKDYNSNIFIDSANDPIEGLYKIYFYLKEDNLLYDVIFIDENMPFMKGSVFTKVYKDLLLTNGFYKIPFVSISSELTGQRDIIKYFDDELNKPCRKKEINYILQKYLISKDF